MKNEIILKASLLLFGIGAGCLISYYISKLKEKKNVFKLILNENIIEIINQSKYFIQEQHLLTFQPLQDYISKLVNETGSKFLAPLVNASNPCVALSAPTMYP